MSNPLFSVIIPTHNGEKRIGRAIDSVFMQTYTNYELFVVCDACTDETKKYVDCLCADGNRYIHTIVTDFRRDGLARNAGINASRGEWILFLDDDDYFMHEYAFQQIADAIEQNPGVDTIDFDFIWKGKRYCSPSKFESFVMVWCRAWRRSFIGDNRFNDLPYGSDRYFYGQLIYNKNVSTYYLHSPVYYYNYMREGSLSWHEHKQKLLDIIITHADEPWEIGKPFFDMLAMQRNVDFDNVTITLVQDGEGTLPDWITSYPFRIEPLFIPNGGPSHARNVGLENGNSQWVMFCDFDDMFTDVCSLSMILDQLPTDEYDIIWGKHLRECKWVTGSTYINKCDAPIINSVAMKLYRRQFLREHNISFQEQTYEHADYIFNAIATTETEPWRIVSLTTDFYTYLKTYRPNSLHHNIRNSIANILTMQSREVNIANELLSRGYDYEYRKHIAAAVAHEFYSIYRPDNGETKHLSPGFIGFYEQARDAFKDVAESDMEVILDTAKTEVLNKIQSMYNEHHQEFYFMNDNISFKDWIAQLDSQVSATNTEPPCVQQPQPPERVVVYCGTANTYENMIASAKSLLANTPVDAVYFLTEDYDFPYDLPDIIHNINIKPLANETFPPSGPNYNNAWTYMCMVRALYPSVFHYDRILSLDIDVVVKSDISDLFTIDMSDYYIAGVEEPQRRKNPNDPPYINFGVTVMNLEKLRSDHMQERLVTELNTRKQGCPEQDAFNKLCAGQILTIPNDYNVTAYSHITGQAQSEKVIHYAGQKFWRHYHNVKQYDDMSWESIMQLQNSMKAGESHG